MKHVKRVPVAALPPLAVIAGLCAILAGVYLLVGLPAALIVGGALAAAGGLLVDV